MLMCGKSTPMRSIAYYTVLKELLMIADLVTPLISGT